MKVIKPFRVYQIELTNYCNGNCSWCPYSKMKRPKGQMSLEMLEKILKKICRVQSYVALHHFGEPLLYDNLKEAIDLCHKYGLRVEFSTNGKLLKENIYKVIDADRIRIAYDRFRPKEAVEELRKVYKKDLRIHTLFGINEVEGTEKKLFDNWAGSVEGKSELKKGVCYFRKYNYGVILWDGRIVNCCVDYDGFDVIGNVDDDFSKLRTRNFFLCKTCKGLQFASGGEWKK